MVTWRHRHTDDGHTGIRTFELFKVDAMLIRIDTKLLSYYLLPFVTLVLNKSYSKEMRMKVVTLLFCPPQLVLQLDSR